MHTSSTKQCSPLHNVITTVLTKTFHGRLIGSQVVGKPAPTLYQMWIDSGQFPGAGGGFCETEPGGGMSCSGIKPVTYVCDIAPGRQTGGRTSPRLRVLGALSR